MIKMDRKKFRTISSWLAWMSLNKFIEERETMNEKSKIFFYLFETEIQKIKHYVLSIKYDSEYWTLRGIL